MKKAWLALTLILCLALAPSCRVRDDYRDRDREETEEEKEREEEEEEETERGRRNPRGGGSSTSATPSSATADDEEGGNPGTSESASGESRSGSLFKPEGGGNSTEGRTAEAPAETRESRPEATEKEGEPLPARTETPETEAPETEAPVTEPPETEPPETREPETQPPRDVDLSSIPGSVTAGGIQRIDRCYDIYGAAYDNAIAGTVSDFDNRIEYVLGGQYQTFSGRIIRDSGASVQGLSNPNRSDIVVVIYGDGIQLYRSVSANLSGGALQDFSVDIRGVNVLTIVINGKNFIRLCNTMLTTQ